MSGKLPSLTDFYHHLPTLGLHRPKAVIPILSDLAEYPRLNDYPPSTLTLYPDPKSFLFPHAPSGITSTRRPTACSAYRRTLSSVVAYQFVRSLGTSQGRITPAKIAENLNSSMCRHESLSLIH